MSIFKEEEEDNNPRYNSKYTKDMLNQVELKEAQRRFSACIRCLKDHIDLTNNDVQFIELLKEMAIRKVYEDSIIHKQF